MSRAYREVRRRVAQLNMSEGRGRLRPGVADVLPPDPAALKQLSHASLSAKYPDLMVIVPIRRVRVITNRARYIAQCAI